MIYYDDGKILVRDMRETDAQQFRDGEVAQGWLNSDIRKFQMRLADQKSGRAVSLTAEYLGNAAGYINVYPDARTGAFGGQGYPEIVDFGVLEKYQRLGIGNRLMDAAEEIAGRFADMVYLGVGLHSGYGSAQRMYVKRGYVPDGSGVWYNDAVCAQYADCRNNDDLVLYLSKRLRKRDREAIQIETERMILRSFLPEDAAGLYEILGDEEVMEYSEPAYDLAKTKNFLNTFCIGREGALAAVHRDSGRLIGYILCREEEAGVYEMGWFFHREFWRQGYAFESCRGLVDYLFGERKAHKIFAETIDTVKSPGLMRKLGMRREGIQRSQVRDRSGNWADMHIYGLLSEEWQGYFAGGEELEDFK